MAKCKWDTENNGYWLCKKPTECTNKSLTKGDGNKCILAKPKPKLRRIKAWAHPDISITANDLVWVAKSKSATYSVPCVIIVAEKCLRRGK